MPSRDGNLAMTKLFAQRGLQGCWLIRHLVLSLFKPGWQGTLVPR